MGAKCYAIITADIVDSRKTESFTRKRDRTLETISRLHLSEKLTLSAYTITAWDEFEVVLSQPVHMARAILDIRRLFFPLQLRIAVGLGAASGVRKQPINVHAGGEAFERARQAADRLKSEFSKYRALTRFESGDEIFDTIANTIYRLQDSLLQATTGKQWAAINMQIETGRQDITAKRMKLNVSTVSRNLKRGYYWHMIETVDAMESIVKTYF
jgi:hypothetical protein